MHYIQNIVNAFDFFICILARLRLIIIDHLLVISCVNKLIFIIYKQKKLDWTQFLSYKRIQLPMNIAYKESYAKPVNRDRNILYMINGYSCFRISANHSISILTWDRFALKMAMNNRVTVVISD